MTILPRFRLEQDEEYVYVYIHTPYVKISKTEMIVENCDFTFYCKPYLLKLTFPYPVIEDERCKGCYDPNDQNGIIKVSLAKALRGQYFENLDLTTLLLQTRVDKDLKDIHIPNIEVISTINYDNENIEGSGSSGKLDEIRPDIFRLSSSTSYGFNLRHQGIFTVLKDSYAEMTEINEPDKTTLLDRRKLRIEQENCLFDPDRYLADTDACEEDYVYNEAKSYVPWWSDYWSKLTYLKSAPKQVLPPIDRISVNLASPSINLGSEDGGGNSSVNNNKEKESASNNSDDSRFSIVFTDEESTALTKLAHREYLNLLPFSTEEYSWLLDLTDVLFACCHEFRMTLGEHTVESAHTISRLSAVLSWFDHFNCRGEAIHGSHTNTSTAAARDPDISRSLRFQQAASSTWSGQQLHTSSTSCNSGPQVSAVISSVEGEGEEVAGGEGDSVWTVVVSCARRALVYPYIRTWSCLKRALVDLTKVLFLGKRAVLKCLLFARTVFEHSGSHYLLNKLYVDDFCMWVQGLHSDALDRLARDVNGAKKRLRKVDVGFDLDELERADVGVEDEQCDNQRQCSAPGGGDRSDDHQTVRVASQSENQADRVSEEGGEWVSKVDVEGALDSGASPSVESDRVALSSALVTSPPVTLTKGFGGADVWQDETVIAGEGDRERGTVGPQGVEAGVGRRLVVELSDVVDTSLVGDLTGLSLSPSVGCDPPR